MLHIHRAERADGLVEELRSVLLDRLEDPFAPEVIAVPTRGMERWLTQRLSTALGATEGRADGVCANVSFPHPSRLLGDAVAAVSGVDPEQDPWLPERAVWPLLEVVDDSLGEPWLRELSTYLGHAGGPPDPVREARRFAAVRHIAELFDRYGLHRPEMIEAWALERDSDDSGRPLPGSARWQAELWRRLRARVALPSPAERLSDACERLRAGEGGQLRTRDGRIVELPDRVSVFGLTRLAAGHVHVVRALAQRRDMHLFLLHPSPALWGAVSREMSRTGRTPIVRRANDPTAEIPSNQLLSSWGRDAREMQLVLAGAHEHVDHHHPLAAPSDRTLLTRIQADVRENRRPSGVPFAGEDDTRPLLEPDDDSVQIHACHGRARQVEVVREAILHLLERDPTLEPRDVIVMCPDVETFAPLVQATFGAAEDSAEAQGAGDAAAAASGAPGAAGGAGHGTDAPAMIDLRVRLADRSIRQTNPLLGVVAQLLDLAGRRLTATQVLDLADREPVRRRFGLDDDDLTRLQGWISEAGIRWGLDAAHRAPYKLDALAAGTWRAGLDRVLLGVTMTEDGERLFREILPLDDVDSGSIELAGRFAELIARLHATVDAFTGRKPIHSWAEAIAQAADALTAMSGRDSWQRTELQRVLDEVTNEAGGPNRDRGTALALAEIRALLAVRLEGRPTRANFRTGHLTVCTLHPMRSVPHRVVCLLGLDDGAFPRKGVRDGDDLMLEDPRIGDRDARTEDRQLLLDALLAATERLIIAYTGNDERTNAPRPPAVPVGELLDLVDATVRAGDGPARDRVVVRHPLQPFDHRNFERGALIRDRIWSFDCVMLRGAQAAGDSRAEPAPFLTRPLPPLDARVVELEDLVRFVQHPVRAFLRQRLRITLSEIAEELEDAMRVELDGLQRWGVGQRLLDARLAGIDGRTAILAEIARGSLPPGVLGRPVIDELYPVVDAIIDAADAAVPPEAPTTSGDVRVVLADGTRVTGTVPALRADVLLGTTFSRVSAKHRLVSWVRLLALSAAYPERPIEAVTVGRSSNRDWDVTIARIPPLADGAGERRETATAQLGTLVDLYARGMREPLPIYCLTSAAYATATVESRDPVAAAQKEWTTDWGFDKEDRELEHQLVLGGVRALDDLMTEPPRDDEGGSGWPEGESSRVGRYARRLWDALLAREEIGYR
jgi:exodeoxyribonuclease V gamma subunit